MAQAEKTTKKKQAPASAEPKKSSATTAKTSSSDTAKKTPEKKPVKTVSEVSAHARFVRIAPRKTRLVANELRGLSVAKAIETLKYIPKKAASPLYKLIESAAANAEHNFNLNRDTLVIKSLTVNEGPTIKRYMPRAHGRATMIRKRMSHISIVLGLKKDAKPAITDKKSATVKATDVKSTSSKSEKSAKKETTSTGATKQKKQ